MSVTTRSDVAADIHTKDKERRYPMLAGWRRDWPTRVTMPQLFSNNNFGTILAVAIDMAVGDDCGSAHLYNLVDCISIGTEEFGDPVKRCRRSSHKKIPSIDFEFHVMIQNFS